MITQWIKDLKETPSRLADRRKQWGSKARKQLKQRAGDGQERLWTLGTSALERVDGALDRTDDVPVVGMLSRGAHKLVTDRLEALTSPPIEGYESLNARAAISAIKELDGRISLVTVRRYEAENKNRKTVLAAIDARL